ncbi:NTP pyrophosphohydrolase [Leucobacter sp. OLJS4]|uniref:NTP pyrophosphohydrolase n=1 Tax=unclassified Leucobacter TaxID=2621730 RepID=UPI000C1815C9|nr:MULTISPECIES: NTP pyrophosphohydrolase [unclassified Leucobacter]PII83793.1 NTP pyrophosphohydrolase [Leucobacter sp. OLCALW19]PII89326.1 NTP pyrophosphohydrolase [Leucobacter sp. OLTLW20]PII90677.1 NTP pyrophosphohydrolase [Leucobacter sp. OLAS13]PII99608.1 NTP pyrophosphohydrolase [Leucobacter sp. OLDS2]PIJ01735.1 NTP pyrophosphohydrolase [Leucobacter sp. OLCS4]
MSASTVAPPAPVGVLAPVSRPSGTVRVRERVIDKVVREAAAVAIGVPRDDVNVEVVEWGGGLAVRIAAKLPVPDLETAEPGEAIMPIVDRVRALQTGLAADVERLTGREVRRVSFTVTGAIIPERKRVR